ncbi:MAG TPA: aldo/keto reductase [Longimicrobiales bacterium]
MPWWKRGEDKPEDESALSRRDFFRKFGGGAAEILRPAGDDPTRRPPPSPMLPHRLLGRTGVTVPILGFGTARLTKQIPDESAAAALLGEAVDLGVTLIDTGSPEGGYDRSQIVVGEVLRQRRRQVFVATKIFEPDGALGWQMLERALRELQVQEVDLLYAHSLGHDYMDPEKALGRGGVLAMLRQARYEGLCRFIGATCHNRSERLVQALSEHELDVIMTPANLADVHTYGFERSVWPLARQKGCGLLAMKVFAGPDEGGHTIARMPRQYHDLAYRYALSLEGCASAVIGMLNRRDLHENVQRARTFQPLGKEDWERVGQIGAELARKWGQHLGEF